jgi:hypothetical protein
MVKTLDKNSRVEQEGLKQGLGPIYRKIGINTFTVGLISVLIGLVIDRAKDTTPKFTLIVLVISIPLVLLLNIRMMRRELEKITTASDDKITEA